MDGQTTKKRFNQLLYTERDSEDNTGKLDTIFMFKNKKNTINTSYAYIQLFLHGLLLSLQFLFLPSRPLLLQNLYFFSASSQLITQLADPNFVVTNIRCSFCKQKEVTVINLTESSSFH